MQDKYVIVSSILIVLITVGGLCVEISLAEDKDKNGVSPNTISLPSGPGSIEGLGESFQPMLNTGTARYAVKIALPSGVAGNTPGLTLQYDSGLGDGPAGIGWAFGPGSISRQVDKGIPRYVDGPNGLDDDHDGVIDETDEVDTFLGPDGEELVKLSDGTYRARIEGSFARYRKVGEHWEVDLKGGTTLFFGVSAGARVTDVSGLRIFRWLLEKSEDVNGNVIEYTYAVFPGSDNQKYLREIRWGPGPASSWTVFYFASLIYEDRPDWRKDYRSGFLIKSTRRLAGINIGIQGITPQQCAPGDWNSDTVTDALIIRYSIEYDNASSYISHLTKITRYGSDNTSSLPPVSFTYSTHLPPIVSSAKDAIIRSENIADTVMDNELVDLIDLNRDGLPDILRTDLYGGMHTAYRNLGSQPQGSKTVIRWDEPISMISDDQLALPLHLAENRVSLADMNGDGISDLVHTALSSDVFYYPNQGDFSWGARQRMSIQDIAPPAPFAFDTVKSSDIDFNKRMDIIKSADTGYSIWFNLEDGKYSYEIHTAGAAHQGRVMLFDDEGVQLEDMNGDRLIDVVQIRSTEVIYAASMGYGIFDTTVAIPIPGMALTDGPNGQIKRAKLTDINGDGLSDLVVERAQANELWFWLNQGTDSFSGKFTITDMPGQFGPNTAIRWADLNGNGTTDLIYADSSAVAKLRMIDIGELVGGSSHPNLLMTINNGLGIVTSITYKSSTDHYLAATVAGEPWTTTVPFPVQTVSHVKTTTGLNLDDLPGNDEYTKDYIYRDGFYEDREKQFRGFAGVKVSEYGDTTAPTKVGIHSFFTGGPDGEDNDEDGETDEVSPELHREEDALKGMVRSLEVRDENGTLFTRDQNSWLVKNLLVSPDGIEIRFAYNRTSDKLIHEGTLTPETISTTFNYDDYGNVTIEWNSGAVSISGDEVFTVTDYINDTDSWMLGFVKNQALVNINFQTVSATKNYYDGYEGEYQSTLSQGRLTLQRGMVDSSTYIDLIRNTYNEYGNITGIMNSRDFSRTISWDLDLHTYPLVETIEVGGGNPDLTISAAYNLGLGVVTDSWDFNANRTTYEYDTFGRLTSIVKPGDSAPFPTQTFEYTLTDTFSSVATRVREMSGQAGTFDAIQYVDGMGRKLALVKESGNDFTVTEAVRFNAFGTPRYSFLPYTSGTSSYTVPTLNPSVSETHYDAMGRPIMVINPPDADSNITSSSVQFFPLKKTTTDENNISKDFISDGLERLVEVHEYNLSSTYITKYEYDTLGNLIKLTDAQKNIKTMQYDGLSRKTAMDDPDRGHMDYVYDTAGNLTQTTDNKGQVIEYTYDGANRMLSEDYLDIAGITPDVSYHYDLTSTDYDSAQNLKGKLAWLTDLSGGKFISYDARGNIEWNINRIKDGPVQRDFRNEYQYDALGRVLKMSYPDGDQITYIYNNGSELETVPGILDSIDYHPSGSINTINYSNGVTTTYTFDPRYRMTGLSTTTPAVGDLIQNLNYTFDGVSNIEAITDLRPVAPSDPSNASQSFLYDDLYRLIHAEGSGYGAIDFGYDSIGNMVSKGSPAFPDPKHIADPLINLGSMNYGGTGGTSDRDAKLPGYQLPGPHAITGTISGLVYDYDDNGNMISHATGDIYAWDFQDRLISVQTTDSFSEYVYDSGGTRVIKKETENGTEKVTWYVNDAFEIRDGKEVKFVYAGNRRVARIEGSLIPTGTSTFQTLDFHTGWNFFSITVQPYNTDITAVLAPIAGKYSEVWMFDSIGKNYIGHDPSSGIFDLPSLTPGNGYAIYITQDTSLKVEGTSVDYGGILWAGWSLIGGPDVGTLSVSEAYATIMPYVTSIWQFDNINKQWNSYLPNEEGFLNTLDQVSPGSGVFLQTSTNVGLIYPQDTKIFYYHPDHLGSSSLVTDTSGAVVERTEYYPFGRPRHEQRTGFDSAYKYTGKELDKSTGLMYYEARYYDSVVGRFVSVDPLVKTAPVKASSYSYVDNNPLMFVDPQGNEKAGVIDLNNKISKIQSVLKNKSDPYRLNLFKSNIRLHKMKVDFKYKQMKHAEKFSTKLVTSNSVSRYEEAQSDSELGLIDPIPGGGVAITILDPLLGPEGLKFNSSDLILTIVDATLDYVSKKSIKEIGKIALKEIASTVGAVLDARSILTKQYIAGEARIDRDFDLDNYPMRADEHKRNTAKFFSQFKEYEKYVNETYEIYKDDIYIDRNSE